MDFDVCCIIWLGIGARVDPELPSEFGPARSSNAERLRVSSLTWVSAFDIQTLRSFNSRRVDDSGCVSVISLDLDEK
jgi:hypothetical protein